jgi:hypothetical protein
MDTLVIMNEFMRRLGRNGIIGHPSPMKAITTTRLNTCITKIPAAQSHTNINTEAQSVSRLLNLPGELREKIWRNVLTSPTGFIKLLWAERKTGVTAKFHYHAINNKAHPRYGNHGIYSRGERTRLAILYTTKQIYRECAHAFWQTNTFVLEPDDLFLVPGLLEEGRLSTSFCRKMRHVQF